MYIIIYIYLQNKREEINTHGQYEATLIYTQGVGRPKFMIQPDQIIFLREYNFSWKKIAGFLGNYFTCL